MTPQEIQALINAKIAGQGSAVDVGGALPQILSGILEIAQSGQKPVLEIEMQAEDETVEHVLDLLTLNGKTPTLEEMLDFEVGSVVYVQGFGKMLATIVNKTAFALIIMFGFYNADYGSGGKIFLNLASPTEPSSSILLFDV
jgi:hypothetical protein